MGCDIHAHWEIMVEDEDVDEEWIHYTKVNIYRDYELFTMLAGVRGPSEECLFKVKGLPKDVSKTTYFDYKRWGRDAHTPSWISSEEYYKLNLLLTMRRENWIDDEMKMFGFLYGNTFSSFEQYREDYPDFVKDFRLVFWFDN